MNCSKYFCWIACIYTFFSVVAIHAQQDTYESKVIDSIFRVISEMDSIQDQISELESQANYFYDFAPWTKVFLDSALTLAQEAQMDKEIAIAIFNQMQFHLFNTQFDSVLLEFEKGMAMEVVQQNNGLRSDFEAMLGTMYKKQGNAKVSIKHFAKALALMEEPGYQATLENEDEKIEALRSLVIINNNLANLYQDLEDYEAAHAAYQDAYDLLMEMNEKAIAGTVWMNKGSIFLKQEKFDSAYLIQSEALVLKEEGGASDRALAMSHLNVGNALLGLGKLDDAALQFERALTTFLEIENKVGLANAYVDFGRLHLERKDFHRARKNCLQGKAIARQVDQLDLQANACECLHLAYRSLGNYASALDNHEELKLLHDSLRNDENTRYITQLEMQYDFDREEERRLVKQEAEAILQESKDQRTRRIFLLLSILLVSAILLAYLWYRNYRIKKHSAAELAEKNLMISRALDDNKLLLKEIHHRVKNNLQVISSLLRLQSRYIEDNAALDAIASGRNRVQSMALLHENLYQDDNLQGVDMQTYFDKLIDGIFGTVNTGGQNIQLQKEIAPITLDIDAVVPLGLITNELITNALKHAFTDKEEGLLKVELFEQKDDLILIVQDDGKGMSEDFFTTKTSSFGHKLIQAFVRNLHAEINVSSNAGTRVELIVRKYQKAS